ncbi:MAG: hypothetical protein K1X66_08705 [Verrucomicrobiae bacterium]|nr:hypothetical protein [Verrucomicrobiae bacterium]
MNHKASQKFWKHYYELSEEIQKLANKAFSLLKENSQHPSLYFKKLGSLDYWSVRINEDYRALAVKQGDTFAWFWIGPHDQYSRKIRKNKN